MRQRSKPTRTKDENMPEKVLAFKPRKTSTEIVPDAPEGEWEAWFFANWLPGATRYHSFAELMQQERLGFLELQARKAKKAGAPSGGPAPSRIQGKGKAPLSWWSRLIRGAAKLSVRVLPGFKSKRK